ncbi:DNA RNA-binding KIN17 [Brachionus plicatilis]|uniref:DNA RNA-binding KIN17 n=1 Tax=Brachionus plicatilis TaxID=10195 RepID=A0A3M7Q4Q2_BRAPC|nr:DNA RNA-binding KIN17 [Brachionus plicatilis]
MGKEKPGFLTPKAIANRIKAKGLQKLRWYCQMCQKQCRDENGFKCHAMSESHQRQLLLFADNAGKFMDDFSSQFHREYINILKRRFGTKRVNANIVYQEYISDRDHVHMNATRWFSLTQYVKFLGRNGICHVEETEKGWFVTYIDRDPETLRRQEEAEKKKKLDLDDRQRQELYLQKQIERAKEKQNEEAHEATELVKPQDEVIRISFKKTAPVFKLAKDSNVPKTSKSEENETSCIKSEPHDPEEKIKDTPRASDESKSEKDKKSDGPAEKRKLSTLEEILVTEEKKREKINRKDYWLHKNIVVKVTTKKLGEKYLNKKGIVADVLDQYTGVVKLIESGTVIKLDQAHLETVLPALGKKVLILNGAYRGEVATMEDINQDKFCASVTIASGPLKGKLVKNVQYEDISKLNQD